MPLRMLSHRSKTAKVRDGAASAPVLGDALPLLAVSALATLAELKGGFLLRTYRPPLCITVQVGR